MNKRTGIPNHTFAHVHRWKYVLAYGWKFTFRVGFLKSISFVFTLTRRLVVPIRFLITIFSPYHYSLFRTAESIETCFCDIVWSARANSTSIRCSIELEKVHCCVVTISRVSNGYLMNIILAVRFNGEKIDYFITSKINNIYDVQYVYS